MGGGEKIQQYKVGIYDKNTDYMISLMNHINSDRDNPILAFAFSNPEELAAYMATKKLDVLLVDEDSLSEVFTFTDRAACILLQKKRDAGANGVSGIFKYSKVRDIVHEILRRINAQDPARSSRLFRSYGVISPLGRCGKTNLSVGLCISDEVRGGVYIGLEEYCGYQDDEDVVSNMIYLAKERSPEFVDYVDDKVVKLERYSVLGYLRSYRDAMELDLSDMLWIMKRLQDWGRYTTVVWDIGQAVLKDLAILEAFDEVVVPVLGDEVSQMKLKAFDNLLQKEELGKVAQRIKKVSVPSAMPESGHMQGFIESELIR